MIKKLLVLVCILLVASVAGNIWFIAGKGIQVYNTYNQQQYQNQQQMQLMMGLIGARGKVVWKAVSYDAMQAMNLKQSRNLDELYAAYKNILPPEVSLFAERGKDGAIIPEFQEDDK